MLSGPANCNISGGTCTEHTTSRMLQIFSLKLAKISVEGASVELYGYIAVRDELDPLLNYVVNVSRDDPIIVEQVRINTYLQLFQGISLVTLPGIDACLLNPSSIDHVSSPLKYSIQSPEAISESSRG